MKRFLEACLNLNVFRGYSYLVKCTFFFFFITFCFVVLFVPQFLWTSYQPTVEEFVISLEKSKTRETPLPNHNPKDVRLVRELSHRMLPPAHNGQVSRHDLPFPSRIVDELRALCDFKRGGYYIEVGAGDKQFFSDMLFFELRLGWTGLLVEADPIKLKLFRRNTWLAPACMSINNSAYEYHHQPYFRLHRRSERYPSNRSHKVICYPFYTFWLALNRPVIDFLSLDVGGKEVEILETIPFDKVDIKIIHVDYTKARDGFMGVIVTLQRRGYKVVTQFLPDFLYFIKKSYNQYYNDI